MSTCKQTMNLPPLLLIKDRLTLIYNKIEGIDYFIKKCNGKIMIALQDRVYRPATRMQLISISEQFNKLKEED